MVDRYFPIDEYESRWSRVHDAMRQKGYDAVVVWSRSGGTADRWADSLYLANFVSTASGQDVDNRLKVAAGFSAVILELDKEPLLIADEPPQPKLVSTSRFEWADDLVSKVTEHLRAMGDKKVALVGSDVIPMKYGPAHFEAHSDLVIDDRLLDWVRMVKSDRELDAQREGGRIVSAALASLIKALLSGKSEADAASIGAAEVIRAGGSYHYIPMAHGDRIEYFTRNPLTGYSLDTPKDGDLARAWIYGPIWQGYWLDPGRTTVIGKPSSDQKRLVEGCASIVESIIEAIVPGTTTSLDLARLGRRLTDELGGVADQASEKWPIFGHGIGLFWDMPEISTVYTDKEVVLEPGITIGVETFLTFEGVGSAGFEQNLIVTSDGTELLTTTPMLWWD